MMDLTWLHQYVADVFNTWVLNRYLLLLTTEGVETVINTPDTTAHVLADKGL